MSVVDKCYGEKQTGQMDKWIQSDGEEVAVLKGSLGRRHRKGDIWTDVREGEAVGHAAMWRQKEQRVQRSCGEGVPGGTEKQPGCLELSEAG